MAIPCCVFGQKQKPKRETKNEKPVFSTPQPLEKVKLQPEKAYTLAGLLALGLNNNPYTRVAWQNALARAAATGEARAAYYPTLTARFEGGGENGYTPGAAGPTDFERVNAAPAIVLEYLLLDFGRRDADLQQTLYALSAANLSFDRQMQKTVFAIQRAYFAHNAALWQEKAATANLELACIIDSMVRDRMKSGLATQPEMLLANKTLSQAQFDQEAAVRNVKVTLGNLRTATGFAANAPLKVATLQAPSSYNELQGKLDAMIDAAVKKRPDLASRVAEVRASEAATRRAKADFLPTVKLEGAYQNQTFRYHAKENNTSGTYSSNQNQFGGFLVAEWEIFDGGERAQRVKKRLAEEEVARSQEEIEKLDAILDVWTAYYDVTTARRRVDFAESLLSSSKESFSALKASFEEGLATITELAAAQNELSASQFERANADANYLTSVAALTLAMGNNWQSEKSSGR